MWTKEDFAKVKYQKHRFLRAVTNTDGYVFGYIVYEVFGDDRKAVVERVVVEERSLGTSLPKDIWYTLKEHLETFTVSAVAQLEEPAMCRMFSKEIGLQPMSDPDDINRVLFVEKNGKPYVDRPIPPFMGKNRIAEVFE